MSFVTISVEEFEEFVSSLGFNYEREVFTQELVFSIPLELVRVEKADVSVKLYTSINICSNLSREKGKDAIRVVLFDRNSQRPLGKQKHTKRTVGWQRRLRDKIFSLILSLKEIPFCPSCGAHMVERQHNGASFLGCSSYPKCKNTESVGGGAFPTEVVGRGKDERVQAILDSQLEDSLKLVLLAVEGLRGKLLRLGNDWHSRCDKASMTKALDLIIQMSPEKAWAFSEWLSKFLGWKEPREEMANGEEISLRIRNVLGALEQIMYRSAQASDSKPYTVEVYGNVDVPQMSKERVKVFGYELEDDLVPVKEFPHFKFPFKHFNPMQSAVAPYVLYSDCNMVVASPTASGKTQVAEMFISQALAEGRRAVYLSPMKALSEEKKADFSEESHPFHERNVFIMTGDYRLTEARKKELEEAEIIICTNEMLDTRTRMAKDEGGSWLNEVGVLVVDEAHLLTMSGRGDATETAIMRFTRLNPSARVVLLSATMANVLELSRWLSKLNGKRTVTVHSTYRPVRLNVHKVLVRGHRRYAEQEEERIRAALQLIQEFPEDKFLVFTGNKAWGRSFTSKLNGLGIPAEFHNADKDLDERSAIENEFKSPDGKIRVMVSTSTTAWGVNMPARRVIVAHTGFGPQKMHPCDVQQMVGRSGRPKYDQEGDAYVIVPENEYGEFERVTQPQIVESRLTELDVLEFHTVAEVYRGEVYDEESFYQWYERTLAFNQARFTAVSFGELFGRLKGYGAVYYDEKSRKWRANSLGRVATWIYYAPRVVAKWRENFDWFVGNDFSSLSFSLDNGKRISAKDVAFAYAFVFGTFECPYVSSRERSLLNNFSEEAGRLFGYREEFERFYTNGYTKLAYVCTALLNGIELSNSYGVFQRAIKYDAERALQAIRLIDEMVAHWGIGDVLRSYELRLKYGVSETLVPLVSIRGIGKARAIELYKLGVRSLRDLLDSPEVGRKVLGSFYSKIVEEHKEKLAEGG